MMKRILIFACVLAVSGGCASGAKKSFTLVVDPPDAEIIVRPGGGRPDQKYRSPADINVRLPEDPAEAAKGRIEIRRNAYKPETIILKSVYAGTVRLKLNKIPKYRMKLRMTHPKPSDDLSYRDRVLAIAIRLTPDGRHFIMSVQNLAEKPIHILWDKSEYDDYRGRPHRIIHSGVKPKKRRRPIPPQEIPTGGSLVQTFMPDDMAVYSREKRAYVSKPLFPLDDDSALGLKGKSFIVTLPVEMDRAIIPDYIFRFEIVDVARES